MYLKSFNKITLNSLQGTQWITTKDIHNIRQKIKRVKTDNKSEEQLLLDEFQRIGNIAQIYIVFSYHLVRTNALHQARLNYFFAL